MEALGREPDAALLILTFLQADLQDEESRDQLLALGRDLGLGLDLDRASPKGCTRDPLDDGGLETDGSGSSYLLPPDLWGARPSVDLHRLDAAAVQRVAQELRVIADRLDQRVVAEAAQNLRRNLLTSTFDKWEGHLSREVSRVMRQSVTLKDVAQEGITVALTLALVKGVCKFTPHLLRQLFSSTLHYLQSQVRC